MLALRTNPKIVANKPIIGKPPKKSKGSTNPAIINPNPINRMIKPKMYPNTCDALPIHSFTHQFKHVKFVSNFYI
jgi:hypothetical protein